MKELKHIYLDSDCKFFEEWDKDLGFLMMPRVVLLSLPAPPTSAPSLPSHILHFCCPELLLSAQRPCLSSSGTTSGRLGRLPTNSPTGSFTFCLANRIPIFGIWAPMSSGMWPSQTQSTAWPGQSQALSSPFPVMVEHGPYDHSASNFGELLRKYNSCLSRESLRSKASPPLLV